jgi:hypothetical protein
MLQISSCALALLGYHYPVMAGEGEEPFLGTTTPHTLDSVDKAPGLLRKTEV